MPRTERDAKEMAKTAIKNCKDKFTDTKASQSAIIECLMSFPYLKASHGQLNYNGKAYSAVRMSGTVGMKFKGTEYFVPMAIFVPMDYPRRVPYLYVCPTSTIAVKENHQHVDSRGTVYLPYLHNWDPRSSSIVGAVRDLTAVFGSDPFIYSRPTPQQQQVLQAQQASQYQQYQAAMPYPQPVMAQLQRPQQGQAMQQPPPVPPPGYQAVKPPAQPAPTQASQKVAPPEVKPAPAPAPAPAPTEDEEPPEEFIDTHFSYELMNDPVVAMDGFTYERKDIEAWLEKHNTSPASGSELDSKTVIPNHSLRARIIEWKEKHGIKD